jgi:hypothetical protein
MAGPPPPAQGDRGNVSRNTPKRKSVDVVGDSVIEKILDWFTDIIPTCTILSVIGFAALILFLLGVLP